LQTTQAEGIQPSAFFFQNFRWNPSFNLWHHFLETLAPALVTKL
jgi:hypothetical protein